MTVAASSSPWDAAVATGLIRLGAGAALIAYAPQLSTYAGAAAADPVVPMVLRGFGVRDTALGVSALAASRPGRDVRRQLHLQAALDVVDAAVCGWLVYSGRLPKVRGAGCAATALASGAVELVLARRLPAHR